MDGLILGSAPDCPIHRIHICLAINSIGAFSAYFPASLNEIGPFWRINHADYPGRPAISGCAEWIRQNYSFDESAS